MRIQCCHRTWLGLGTHCAWGLKAPTSTCLLAAGICAMLGQSRESVQGGVQASGQGAAVLTLLHTNASAAVPGAELPNVCLRNSSTRCPRCRFVARAQVPAAVPGEESGGAARALRRDCARRHRRLHHPGAPYAAIDNITYVISIVKSCGVQDSHDAVCTSCWVGASAQQVLLLLETSKLTARFCRRSSTTGRTASTCCRRAS